LNRPDCNTLRDAVRLWMRDEPLTNSDERSTSRSALAGFTLPPPTGSAYVVETAQREGRVPDLAALDAGAAACVSQPYIAGVLALPVRFARPQRSGVRGY
jgi:hypothetical protein